VNNTEKIIRLAEWMGWVHTYDDKPVGMIMDPPDGWWLSPDGGWSVTLDFDPYEDANDCEALISKLTSMGWNVEIYHGTYTQDVRDEDPDHIYINGYRVFVHIWNIDTEEHHRKDMDQDSWKQGIAELTLRIIDENDSP